MEKIIESPLAVFKPGKGWLIQEGRIIKNLSAKDFPEIEIIKNKKIRLPILEFPNDFKQIESDVTTLNIAQLFHYTNRLEKSGISTHEYKAILLEKISSPLTCILFALLSSTLVFKGGRRQVSLGKNLIFSLVFAVLYGSFSNYAMQMAKASKLSPLVASLGPLGILLGVLLLLFHKNRRLS